METMYKTKAAAKAQATRQKKKYNIDLEVYGSESTGYGLRRPLPQSESLTEDIYIGSEKEAVK